MLMYVGIGVGGLLLLAVIAFFILADNRTPVRMMEEDDGGDPLKRWARGCYAMIYGGKDPGTYRNCKSNLAQWWDISSREQALETLEELGEPDPENPAWDYVRAILVSRFANGAGYITEEESWKVIEAVRGPLQAAYAGWPELAEAYAEARTEAGFDTDQLSEHREAAESIWKLVPFR